MYITICFSLFRYFRRGALDIYQCFMINVNNCTFLNNGFLGVFKDRYQYRGHAGGLSIGRQIYCIIILIVLIQT